MAREITEAERQSRERLKREFAKPQTPEERAFASDPNESNLARLVDTARNHGPSR